MAAQVAAVGIVVAVFRSDRERFFEGWKLDRGLWVAVASVGLQGATVVGVVATCWVAREEEGYELIPEVGRGRR